MVCPICGKEMIPEWDANDDMGTWLECLEDHVRIRAEGKLNFRDGEIQGDRV